jgi:hypothetical protein
LVVEATLSDIISGYLYSKLSPRAVLGSLCAWSIRFGVAIWLCEDHENAAAVAQRLLENFAISALRQTAVPERERTSIAGAIPVADR